MWYTFLKLLYRSPLDTEGPVWYSSPHLTKTVFPVFPPKIFFVFIKKKIVLAWEMEVYIDFTTQRWKREEKGQIFFSLHVHVQSRTASLRFMSQVNVHHLPHLVVFWSVGLIFVLHRGTIFPHLDSQLCLFVCTKYFVCFMSHVWNTVWPILLDLNVSRDLIVYVHPNKERQESGDWDVTLKLTWIRKIVKIKCTGSNTLELSQHMQMLTPGRFTLFRC
jgi:hypothetical protein